MATGGQRLSGDLTQFNNRPVDWGTLEVEARFKTQYQLNRTSIPHIFVQLNGFPFRLRAIDQTKFCPLK